MERRLVYVWWGEEQLAQGDGESGEGRIPGPASVLFKASAQAGIWGRGLMPLTALDAPSTVATPDGQKCVPSPQKPLFCSSPLVSGRPVGIGEM